MNVQEFRTNLLQSIYAHIYLRLEDNFDHMRYGQDGVDRSAMVDAAMHAQYLEFVLANIESFCASRLLLADAASRDLFIQLVKYRFLGHPHVRIREGVTWTTTKAMYDKGGLYDAGPSSTGFKGLFGELRHHENVPVEHGTVKIDAWNVSVAYGLGAGEHRQYYFKRDGLEIKPEPGDYVIDGGSCFGDTSMFFAGSVGPSGRVFGFDPLPTHVDIVRFNIRQNNMEDRVVITPAGIGETSNHLAAAASTLDNIASPGFSLLGRENMAPIISIDDFVEREKIPKIDFIKMDIEGFELSALKGAAKTIAKHRPKLAISLYHKPQDFFEIPLYLKSLFPFYRLYLDHYTIFSEETVLFAVAE